MPERFTVALLYGHRLHVGGVENHLLALLRYADPVRFRWVMVAPASPTFAQRVATLGGEFVAWVPRSAADAGALMRLIHILRAHRVDLVHAHDARSAALGRVAARLLRLPVVVTVHLPSYYYVRGRSLAARLKRRFYVVAERLLNSCLTDRVIYVSHSVHREALALKVAPRRRSLVIENGVELEPYTGLVRREEVRRALGTPMGVTVTCFAGRLDYQKGVDVLLEAVGLLRPSPQRFQLWVVGDGRLRGTLEAQAAGLGLKEVVLFLGYRDDVPDILRASDVFVLPSRYEAMPVVLLEAMAAGLPSVVTSVGDNPRLVENHITGRVVPPEDPAALAAALSELLLDPGLRRRMGAAAQQRVQDYNAVCMVSRIGAVYEQLA